MSYFRNSFATEEYQLVTPRLKRQHKLPAMDVFDPTTSELQQYGNFLAEFKKWIPSLQFKYYLGDMDPTAEDIENGNVTTITHNQGNTETQVTQDYYVAYTEYSVEPGEMDDVWLQNAGDYRPTDNVDAILQLEEQGYEVDAFTSWNASFVHGIRHHSAEWGPGTESNEDIWAGKNSLANYSNLDEDTSLTNWNHFFTPETDEYDTALFNGNQAFFIQDDLDMLKNDLGLGANPWEGLNAWAAGKFGSRNFYEVVMDYYKGSNMGGGGPLTFEEAMKFTLLLKESKYRMWEAMETFVGPLADTRTNNANMMSTVESFISRNKPHLNYVSISLFLNMFRIQHNLTNFMTGFWLGDGGIDEEGRDSRMGNSQSRLDNYRFWNFAQELGSNGFRHYLTEERAVKYRQSDGDPLDEADEDQTGKLYDYRADFSELADIEAYDEALEQLDGLDAEDDAALIAELQDKIAKFDYVDGLIEDHFGAYYPGYTPEHAEFPVSAQPTSSDRVDYGMIDGDIVPLFSDYKSNPILSSEDMPGSWHAIPGDFAADMAAEGYGDYSHIFIPDIEYPSLGYDRKFNENCLRISDDGTWDGTLSYVNRKYDVELWVKLHNHFSPEAYIHDGFSDSSHAHINYTASQVKQLSNTWITTGYYYSHNWVVRVAGKLYKEGLRRGFEKIIYRGMKRRNNKREYDKATEEYDNAKSRIASEKMAEARQRSRRKEREGWVKKAQAKKKSRFKNLQKKASQRISQRRAADKRTHNSILQKRSQRRAQERVSARRARERRRRAAKA